MQVKKRLVPVLVQLSASSLEKHQSFHIRIADDTVLAEFLTAIDESKSRVFFVLIPRLEILHTKSFDWCKKKKH